MYWLFCFVRYIIISFCDGKFYRVSRFTDNNTIALLMKQQNSSAKYSLLAILLGAFSALSQCSLVACFEWSIGGRPEVTRQAIAGLWKLTPQPTYPLKEYTVRHGPKYRFSQQARANANKQQDKKELLLMLKEDGSFQQYLNDVGEETIEDDEDVENTSHADVMDKWKQFQESQRQKNNHQREVRKASKKNREVSSSSDLSQEIVKGVWDYRDGKLILAADRPENNELAQRSDGIREKQFDAAASKRRKHCLDKLIIGRVIATYEDSLKENPILLEKDQNETSLSHSETPRESSEKSAMDPEKKGQLKTSDKTNVDAHLSVPKGSLKVGKFFYPKNHPSFFEQPIYNPVTESQKYQLQQVLGSLNTQKSGADEEPVVQRFQLSDFYNRTFLLSSHPLGRPAKKRLPSQQRKQDILEAMMSRKGKSDSGKINPLAEASQIRVMQVKFFPNNTFATVWGTGDAILRGKFDLFNKDNSRLWMQIMRFGFGRSIKGSVYSEGRSLSHEDAKTYWGEISRYKLVNGTSGTSNAVAEDGSLKEDDSSSADENDNPEETFLQVEGSVMFGGVGAEPVGRFLMREMQKDEILMDEDEDDEDEDSLLEDDEEEEYIEMDVSAENADLPSWDSIVAQSDDAGFQSQSDGVDWKSLDGEDEEGLDAFQ